MINRVQAFNNKNNYKQNFGMAVGYADEATREAMIKIGQIWGKPGRGIVQDTIQELQKAREGDKCVDIVFHLIPDEADRVYADVFYKRTGKQIPKCERRGADIHSERAPKAVSDELLALNEEAAKVEREMQDEDMLAGVTKIKCSY